MGTVKAHLSKGVYENLSQRLTWTINVYYNLDSELCTGCNTGSYQAFKKLGANCLGKAVLNAGGGGGATDVAVLEVLKNAYM